MLCESVYLAFEEGLAVKRFRWKEAYLQLDSKRKYSTTINTMAIIFRKIS